MSDHDCANGCDHQVHAAIKHVESSAETHLLKDHLMRNLTEPAKIIHNVLTPMSIIKLESDCELIYTYFGRKDVVLFMYLSLFY